MMKTFTDFYGNEVHLSFEEHPFSSDPRHVWVICRFNDQWLLTDHKRRGIEFPGGKVEPGESAREAAIREVFEETGGEIKSIFYIGQYKVNGKADTIIKNVYFAHVSSMEKRPTYYETNGPILLEKLPPNLKDNPNFSFMMKDDVLTYSLSEIQKLLT
jgi:8-oxo-dGTP diphosphatase